MKIAMSGVLMLFAALNAGCVTEGAARREPAPDAEQAEANLALGVGYLQEERPDLAIEALVRAIEIQPRSADAHSVIAIAYDQTQRYELAEEHHRRAAELAPRNANIQNGYAVFLCRRDRGGEAGPYFDRAIAASRDASALTATMNAAACARAAGDFEAAERYFRAALDIDRGNADALRGMMDVSIRSENFTGGLAFWQRLESSTQVQADDLLSCYLIEQGLGNDPAARDCADRLRQEFPGSPALTRLRELERNAS